MNPQSTMEDLARNRLGCPGFLQVLLAPSCEARDETGAQAPPAFAPRIFMLGCARGRPENEGYIK